MTSGQISSGLDLTYAPSTITMQQPTEGELDLLFEAMYDDYFGGQPSANVENVSPAQEPQVRQTSTASTSIADNNIGNRVIQNAVQNPRVQNIRNQNGLIGVQRNRNQNQIGNGNLVAVRTEGNAAGQNKNPIRCYNCKGVGHFARNCTVRPRRRDVAYLQTQLLIAQKEEAGIQLQDQEYDLMAAAADLDEIKEVNANCILMANLQQASTSGTQSDKAPIYDSDGSAEVYDYENYDDNEIFNMFTQEEQYTELLEPIPEPHQVPQNNNAIISENLAIEVEKVNSVNRKLKETNTDLTTELARFKNQEKCFEISQEKYDKLERCYQQSVYQEQCLSKKINALHLSIESHEKMKQLNKEIKPANYTKINHLSGVFISQTAKSHEDLYFSNDSKTANVSKSISIPNEELSDDTTPSVARKFLNEVKSTIVTLQCIVKHIMTLETHNWSSSAHQELYKIIKDEIFPIVNQVDARVQNFEIQFLKEATKFIGDFKSLSKEADESLAKHKTLELEIKRLLRAIVSQDIMSVVQKTYVIDTLNLQTDLEFTSNSNPTPQDSKVVKNDKVIFPGMFRINPFKTSREEKHVPNNVRASARTKPITVSQHPVITKNDVNSDSNGLSSTGIDNTKTRRP
nr:hypothetical protein [Tanacetum cinerariifolium]